LGFLPVLRASLARCGLPWIIPWIIVAATAATASPRITYVKSFPGSTPAYVSITVDQSGKVAYQETQDDDPETFQLEADVTRQLFDLAQKLDRFRRPIESGLKIASMGAKTFRWEDDGGKSEVTFNYSTNEDAKVLWDWFERVTESERETLVLRQTMRHDKLGVDAALLGVQNSWDRKRLVATAQMLPLLDQLARDEKYMHMARERAAGLAEAIRASGRGAAGKGKVE